SVASPPTKHHIAQGGMVASAELAIALRNPRDGKHIDSGDGAVKMTHQREWIAVAVSWTNSPPIAVIAWQIAATVKHQAIPVTTARTQNSAHRTCQTSERFTKCKTVAPAIASKASTTVSTVGTFASGRILVVG